MLRAGVPATALQCLPGDGATVGRALTSDPRVQGVAFTGSTDTALAIRRAMADHLHPCAPLIAETGGLNAMVVDSTALPEQAVRDVIASAFQSAGQRCSALRCLYVQEDVADAVTAMLTGAMRDLSLADPWDLATDIGPVIDAEAAADIRAHVDAARAEGRVLAELAAPATGSFVGPAVLRVRGIADLGREVFGPVLHLATFRAADLDRVISDVNATGYGLTFGLHTRIDDRVQAVVSRIRAGNTYVNRNQIGAVVGSQPFGGEGLSGTGPKAGGPHYLARFTRTLAPDALPPRPARRMRWRCAAHSPPWPGPHLLSPRATCRAPRANRTACRSGRVCQSCALAPRQPRHWRRRNRCAALAGRRWRRQVCPPGRWPASPDFQGPSGGGRDGGARPCAGACRAAGADPAPDRRPARSRPCPAGTACLHRHHGLGRQCATAGRGA